MVDSRASACHLIRPGATRYEGRQGFAYFEGIATQTVGSLGICMHTLTIPPGARAKAHMHERHETALYVLEGEATTYWGQKLEHATITRAGDMFYIPAGMPHLPVNTGNGVCSAVIARTDPNEQESVVLLPELDGLVPA